MEKILLRSVRDAEVAGKRVLLSTSLNVPVGADGTVSDLFRLKRGLPTIEHLSKSGAKIVIVGYFGREGATLRPVYEALVNLAPQLTFRFSTTSPESCGPEVEALSAGECLVLENMRMYPGEETNDSIFAQSLAALGDLFVSDGFAEAHRPYASNVGVASLIPSCAGLLLEEEVSRLSDALEPPPGSIAIVAGAKFETKEPLIKKLLELYGNVCVGGALANDFLKAQGISVGVSLISDAPVPESLAQDHRILVQSDVVVSNGTSSRTCPVADIHPDERVVDAGPQTSQQWSEEILHTPFLLWNGPLGVYEQNFVQATDALAEALTRSRARAVVGG